MPKKKITIVIIISLLTFLLGSIFLFSADNKYIKKLNLLIPTPVKTFIKNTVFIFPNHFREFNYLVKKTGVLQGEIFKLKSENSVLKSAIFGGQNTSNEIIKSKNGREFKLKLFQLPWNNYWASDPKQRNNHKKDAYLDSYLDDVYVVFITGKIIKFNKNDIRKQFLDTKEIKNNILDFLKNSNQRWVGVKDILILKDEIFVSYSKAIGDPENKCYNTSVLKGTLNSDKIFFKEFFTHDDCLNFNQREGSAQAGGRMVIYKDSLLLTGGDFKDNDLYKTNIEKRLFSKILSINLKTKKHKIISQGLRNSQGLLYVEEQDLIIASDHGPKGGDEVNRILMDKKEIPHYGWPFASHGDFYGFESTELRKNIMQFKNHKDNGYIEPILIFTPAIGPSEIVRANYKSKNSFLVSSLNGKTLYEFEYTKKDIRAKLTDDIYIGERIRDIKLMENGEYFLILANTGTFAILRPL